MSSLLIHPNSNSILIEKIYSQGISLYDFVATLSDDKPKEVFERLYDSGVIPIRIALAANSSTPVNILGLLEKKHRGDIGGMKIFEKLAANPSTPKNIYAKIWNYTNSHEISVALLENSAVPRELVVTIWNRLFPTGNFKVLEKLITNGRVSELFMAKAKVLCWNYNHDLDLSNLFLCPTSNDYVHILKKEYPDVHNNMPREWLEGLIRTDIERYCQLSLEDLKTNA